MYDDSAGGNTNNGTNLWAKLETYNSYEIKGVWSKITAFQSRSYPGYEEAGFDYLENSGPLSRFSTS